MDIEKLATGSFCLAVVVCGAVLAILVTWTAGAYLGWWA